MLFRANWDTKIISLDEQGYDLEGMIQPTFYNQGSVAVKINQVDVLPGEQFSVGVPNAVMSGKVDITFDASASGAKQLILNYATYQGPAVNPINGQPGSSAGRFMTQNC